MRTLQNYFKTSAATVLLFIIGLLATSRTWAQQRGVDIEIDANGNNAPWYGAWWVWVVGIGLFAIIIVAIISAGKKT